MKCIFYLLIAPIIIFADTTDRPADLHFISGLEYYRSGDIGKAKAEFQKALEAEKQHSGSIKMLQVLENEIFKEDLSDPFNGVIKVYFEKGMDFFRRADKDNALQEWERALAISPANRQLQEFCELAKPLEKKQHKEEKKAAKIGTNTGAGKAADKNIALCIKNSERISSNSPNMVDEKNVNNLYYEGLKYYKLGDLKKAISLWEQVLLLDPNLSKARKNLDNAKKQLISGEKR